MPTHVHFEELCALATSGQLSAAESDILNRHLVECDHCRMFLKDAQVISDWVIPQTLHSLRGETRVTPEMRDRFLARAACAGLKIQVGAPVAAAEMAERVPQQKPAAPPRPLFWVYKVCAALCSPQVWAIAGLAGLGCFALGLAVKITFFAGWRDASGNSAPPVPVRQTAPISTAANAGLERMRALTTEHDQLSHQVADLMRQLQAVQKEKQQTESALQQKLAVSQSDAAHDHDVLTQQAAALSAHAADLESQLETARAQESLAAVDLRNSRAKNSEYATRLDLVQSQLRSQEAASQPIPNEASSLVAARNLHIIDVYDSNSDGKRGRAFGRVFYVEGRSLVFYAYDLPVARAQKSISFHLWGEKVGGSQMTLSLGVLHDDDPRERRWALTCNDRTVLAEINSVYVTAESPGNPNDAPHGPRVLYAYFGAPPNHP